MSIFDVCDEVAGVLEPDATKRDDARVRPFEFVAGKTYVWPMAEQYTSDQTDGGYSDTLKFRLRAAHVIGAEAEEASLTPDRTISQTLQDKARSFRDNVAAARSQPGGGTTFEWLAVDAVDYDSLSTTHTRGFQMDLSGYGVL